MHVLALVLVIHQYTSYYNRVILYQRVYYTYGDTRAITSTSAGKTTEILISEVNLRKIM